MLVGELKHSNSNMSHRSVCLQRVVYYSGDTVDAVNYIKIIARQIGLAIYHYNYSVIIQYTVVLCNELVIVNLKQVDACIRNNPKGPRTQLRSEIKFAISRIYPNLLLIIFKVHFKLWQYNNITNSLIKNSKYTK